MTETTRKIEIEKNFLNDYEHLQNSTANITLNGEILNSFV